MAQLGKSRLVSYLFRHLELLYRPPDCDETLSSFSPTSALARTRLTILVLVFLDVFFGTFVLELECMLHQVLYKTHPARDIYSTTMAVMSTWTAGSSPFWIRRRRMLRNSCISVLFSLVVIFVFTAVTIHLAVQSHDSKHMKLESRQFQLGGLFGGDSIQVSKARRTYMDGRIELTSKR